MSGHAECCATARLVLEGKTRTYVGAAQELAVGVLLSLRATLRRMDPVWNRVDDDVVPPGACAVCGRHVGQTFGGLCIDCDAASGD